MVCACAGELVPELELRRGDFAMQVGTELWLRSDGSQLDDYFNHSCDPNVGFVTGEPVLYALRDVAPGDELCWDYSTSIAVRGWRMRCHCGTPPCRGTVLPFPSLPAAERKRLRPLTLRYLRNGKA